MIQTPQQKRDEAKKRRHDMIFGGTAANFQLGKAEKLAHAVKELDRKFEEELAAKRAKELGLPYFNLYAVPIDQDALAVLTEEQARGGQLLPFYREKNYIKIGMLDPANPKLNSLMSDLEKRHFEADLYIISKSAYDRAMENYKAIRAPQKDLEQVHIESDSPGALQRLRHLQAIGEEIQRVSATELMNILLTSAVAMRSSDIHLQPESDYISVRFRIDGVLQETAKFHNAVYHSLISRIKILSKLKINLTKLPQDGSFVVETAGQNYEIRVSLLPSTYGEAVVMRILGDLIALEFEQLGLQHLAYSVVEREIKKPNGLILTTGPTGSGKTTTLYSFLKRANKPGIKIITLENPVEYRLEGIEQIQIDEKSGLTFASALRSVLRQDPDVCMVGEIRDFDTAEVAAQAALTGHMVYSTLHTNDAAGAIPRLLNLGVKAVILAPALSCVIAQRLVRKLCPDCKTVEKIDASLRSRIDHILSTIPKNSGAEIPNSGAFYRGAGCSACNYIGYRGRIGIFEVFPVDEAMQQLIFAGSSTVEIKAQAVKSGMISMIQDGLLKALKGVTDVAEVFRVTEE